MPSFSQQSQERLSTCDERLIALFKHVITFFDCTIIEGHRSYERQQHLYEIGATRVQAGKHNAYPSLAVDVAPYPIRWDDLERFYYFAGNVMGVANMLEFSIRWGGDWDGDTQLHDQSFMDLVHFEIGHHPS